MIVYRITKAIISALALGFATTTGTAAALEPLILAVHPYSPPAEIIARLTPRAGYFARAVGRSVVVRVGPSNGQYIETTGRNNVDIAFIGSYAYVKMTSRYGAKPLLACIESKGKRFLSSYIVTRDDSPLRNLSELRGKCSRLAIRMPS